MARTPVLPLVVSVDEQNSLVCCFFSLQGEYVRCCVVTYIDPASPISHNQLTPHSLDVCRTHPLLAKKSKSFVPFTTASVQSVIELFNAVGTP